MPSWPELLRAGGSSGTQFASIEQGRFALTATKGRPVLMGVRSDHEGGLKDPTSQDFDCRQRVLDPVVSVSSPLAGRVRSGHRRQWKASG